MLENYKIGSFTLQIEADFQMADTGLADMFRIKEPGKLKCICTSEQRLIESPGPEIYKDEKMTARMVDGGTERTLYMPLPKNRPYMVVTDRACGRRMFLRYSAADLSWSRSFNYFWPAMGIYHYIMLTGNLLMRSAYVTVGGKAILFTAPSGTGKTTQAVLWAKYRGGKIINGDRAVIGRENGVSMAYGVPVSGTSRICHNQTAPIKAIVSLRQAPENKAVVLRGPKALSALAPSLALDTWRSGDYAAALSILSDIIADVPVISLECTPDVGAVEELEKLLKII